MADGRETVGNDHSCTHQVVEIVANGLLRDVVESRCCLIEEDDVGLRDERPRNEDTLLLSATESSSAFRHHSMESHRHVAHILFQTGHPQGIPRIVVRSPRSCNGDIMKQVTCKKASALEAAAYLTS